VSAALAGATGPVTAEALKQLEADAAAKA